MYSLIPFAGRNAGILRYMDGIEHEFFNHSLNGASQLRCNISETNTGYLLEAELPGFDKSDISVQVGDGLLTISASYGDDKSDANAKTSYIRRERRCGSFSRSFGTEGIDEDNISADYKNGVLLLTLPKAQKNQPGTRRIPVGGIETAAPN